MTLLKSLIKENLDSAIFEDSMRCIFGKDACVMFSIERIFNLIAKNMPNDDFGSWVLEENRNLFLNESKPDEYTDIVKQSRAIRKLM
jgi:hypothetical protein